MTTDTNAAGFSPAPGKTDPAELVITEEMIEAVARLLIVEKWGEDEADDWPSYRPEAIAILRAVAPMIAARAAKHDATLVSLCEAHGIAVRAAEREACAQIAENYCTTSTRRMCEIIAAAIRARGETT